MTLLAIAIIAIVAQNDALPPPRLCPWLRAPTVKPDQNRWVTSISEGFAESRRRHCPIVVIVGQDSAEGVHTSWQELINTHPFRELTRKAVFIPAIEAHYDEYPQKEVDGQEVNWCEWFQMPCQERHEAYQYFHRRLVKAVYWQPLIVILDSNGQEIDRMEGHRVEHDQVQEAIDDAQSSMGRPLRFGLYRELMTSIRRIVDDEKSPLQKRLDRIQVKMAKVNKEGFSPLLKAIESGFREQSTVLWQQIQDFAKKNQRAEAIDALRSYIHICAGLTDLKEAEALLRSLTTKPRK